MTVLLFQKSGQGLMPTFQTCYQSGLAHELRAGTLTVRWAETHAAASRLENASRAELRRFVVPGLTLPAGAYVHAVVHNWIRTLQVSSASTLQPERLWPEWAASSF